MNLELMVFSLSIWLVFHDHKEIIKSDIEFVYAMLSLFGIIGFLIGSTWDIWNG